jgi:hypothetical protein
METAQDATPSDLGSSTNLSVIIPVLNDSASLRTLLDGLSAALAGRREASSVIIVDDGSSPALSPQDLGVAALPGTIVRLKRNVGHQRAIAIGLGYAATATSSDMIVVMDGDGEDRPEDVAALLDVLAASPRNVIVVGERARRRESAWFVAMYHVYRLIFVILTGRGIRFGNFCAMRIGAARRLAEMAELWLNLPATILRSRLPVARLAVARSQRYAGRSHMNFTALVVHGLSATAVFLERVLARMIVGAAGLAILGFMASAIAVVQNFSGAATPGWMTTVVGTSLIIVVMAGVFCLVGLLIGLSGNVFLMPAPAMTHSALIAELVPFGAAGRQRTPALHRESDVPAPAAEVR